MRQKHDGLRVENAMQLEWFGSPQRASLFLQILLLLLLLSLLSDPLLIFVIVVATAAFAVVVAAAALILYLFVGLLCCWLQAFSSF